MEGTLYYCNLLIVLDKTTQETIIAKQQAKIEQLKS